MNKNIKLWIAFFAIAGLILLVCLWYFNSWSYQFDQRVKKYKESDDKYQHQIDSMKAKFYDENNAAQRHIDSLKGYYK